MALPRKDLHRLKIEELTDYEKALYEEFSEIMSDIFGEKIELVRGKVLLDFLLASEEERKRLSEQMITDGEATLAEASLKLMDHEEWRSNIIRGLKMMNDLIEKNKVRIVRITKEIRDLSPEEIEALKKTPDAEVGSKEFTGRFIISLVVETGKKSIF